MRRSLPVPLASLALVLAACAQSPTVTEPTVAPTEGPRYAITTTTTCQKEPGPTNTIESTSTNPAGKEPRGQQEPDQELSNRETKNCRDK